MNYYLPITDDKRRGATVAFSQKGYDANLRINIPQMDYLKLRGDYYYFDGKYGGEDDKGFRYGLEVQPISDLRIGVFYDDGGEKFGGDIVYVYNFGIPQKRESKVAFSPDLFSPVVREYSQRILITTTERIEVLRTSISDIGNIGNDDKNSNRGDDNDNYYDNGGNDDNDVCDKKYDDGKPDGNRQFYDYYTGQV